MGDVEFNKNLVIRNPGRFAEEFENSKKLPTFATQHEADQYFIKKKEEALEIFSEFLTRNNFFAPTYSPESLKDLESLYYKLYEEGRFEEGLIGIEDFELFMSIYFGEVMVRHGNGFSWKGAKHFLTNNAYYLAIERPFLSWAIARLKDFYATKNNKTKKSLYRKFSSYFS
jgi:hypothetical protein